MQQAWSGKKSSVHTSAKAKEAQELLQLLPYKLKPSQKPDLYIDCEMEVFGDLNKKKSGSSEPKDKWPHSIMDNHVK